MIQNNIALISINATLVVQLISFLIFLFIINRIMFRPLEQVRESRKARMEELKQAIAEAERQAEEMAEILAREETKTKEEAFERQKVIAEETRVKLKQIHDDVKFEIETLKVQNQKTIEDQIITVKQSLPEEVHKVVRVILEKALDRRLADGTL